jgi:hypothetical protein
MKGSYEAVVFDAGLTEDKFGESEDQTRAEIQFQIDEGEHKGRIVAWTGNFGDSVHGGKSRTQWTFETLRMLGLKDDDLTELAALKGARANVSVEEGKSRSYVKYVNPPGGFGIKPIGGSQAKDFAARMKAKLRGANGNQPSGGTSFNPSEWDDGGSVIK